MIEYLRLLDPNFLSQIANDWKQRDTLTACGVVAVVFVLVYWVTRRK